MHVSRSDHGMKFPLQCKLSASHIKEHSGAYIKERPWIGVDKANAHTK